MRWVSASHYFHPIEEGMCLPPLEHAIKDHCREPIRRADRFIQLALIGSARCVAGYRLDPDCGLYLGSGLGPIGSNIETQKQLVRDLEIPKPFNFINTLGASAGFYVARNLGLSGQNHFISRRHASLCALLHLAATDLDLGITRQALVGVVEEVTLPLQEHRLRQGLQADVLVAEGSHWLFLQQDGFGPHALRVKRFACLESLLSDLETAWKPGDLVYSASTIDPQAADLLCNRYPASLWPDGKHAFHDSLDAAWLTECLNGKRGVGRFLVDGAADRSWSLFHFGS